MTVKNKKLINFGIIKIKSTNNNLFITLTDFNGNVLISKHSGLLNFESNKRTTPYVAGQLFKSLMKSFNKLKIEVKLYIIQIIGAENISLSRNILYKIKELKIKNVLCIQLRYKKVHNGIRLQKKKRI